MEGTSFEAFAVRLNNGYVATRFAPSIAMDYGRSGDQESRGQNSRPVSIMRLSAHEVLGFHDQCHEDLTVDAILGGEARILCQYGDERPSGIEQHSEIPQKRAERRQHRPSAPTLR